jgi:hypothetical protein
MDDARDNWPHPTQPVALDADGVLRFKQNTIVRDLLDVASAHGLDLNEIARRQYCDEDRVQLAQLIGYSVSGFGELSYVSDEAYARATEGCDDE